MKRFPKPVFFTCGDTTLFLGSGRKEFNPKKSRPGLEQYIAEAGQAAAKELGDATLIVLAGE